MLLLDRDSDSGAVISYRNPSKPKLRLVVNNEGVATLEVIVKSHHFLHSTAVRFATGYQVLVPNQLVVDGKDNGAVHNGAVNEYLLNLFEVLQGEFFHKKRSYYYTAVPFSN